MQSHVVLLRELADLAARELVIEQGVDYIAKAFMEKELLFVVDDEAGIKGGSARGRLFRVWRWCEYWCVVRARWQHFGAG